MSNKSHDHNYVRIYGVLMVLLVVSVLGPLAGVKLVTLVTAFGIAAVKAFLVCKYFMHLDAEPRFVRWLLSIVVVLMVVLFYGVAPDVMKHEGRQWKKDMDIQWHQTSEAYRAAHPAGGSEHGDVGEQH